MRFTFDKALWLGMITLSLFACGGGDNVGPNTPITFLATGAQYNYYYKDIFHADSLKSVVQEQIGKDTFLIRNYSVSVPIVPTQYWVIKNGAFYSSFRLRDPDSYVIECKFNAGVGTSWSVKKGNVTYTYSIDALNVAFITGTGTINDAVKIKIAYPGSSSTYYQYVSPSVGPLGTGNFDDPNASLRLVKYKTGTAATTTNVVPSITFGNFSFLKVGTYWKYNESTLFSSDVLTTTVESKLPNTNIYKVLSSYASAGTSFYSYWFEDNGYLMVYEDGEQLLQADPIYVSDAKAVIGQGWGGLTSTGKVFIYTVKALNQSEDTYFGNIPTTEIYVTDGLFTSQNNYWNANKGNVLVSGVVSRDVTDSNARLSAKQKPFVPIFGI